MSIVAYPFFYVYTIEQNKDFVQLERAEMFILHQIFFISFGRSIYHQTIMPDSRLCISKCEDIHHSCELYDRDMSVAI